MIKNSIVRWIISLSLGLMATLATFWFMNFMISSNDYALDESSTYKLIDFVSLTQKIEEPEIKKELPPEPKEQKDPPKVDTKVEKSQNVNEADEPKPLNMEAPSLSGEVNGKGGLSNNRTLAPMKIAKMDSALTPMIRIKPIYPSRAKRMGVEGFVKVNLEVDATGHVTDIIIIESKPKGAFDKSVRKALRKWKFRPKTIDGKPVAQTGELILNFKLGND